ncbi:DnaB-like helicase N-terminal domain-containing protein [Streptomyces sp. GZWMJZ-114]|uniref:DnaB-like helicase N-terminal domain-containing protein n=1 Tax=Streptomyces sp. GZWMJZ-114 TaxID=2494734 RepID=UPI001012AB1F|nr:DnaB-like helicase N-terminal domain-containing protein [Streptomyces sp. GZWMJZ-114]
MIPTLHPTLTPAFLVEQALLGTLLLDPSRSTELTADSLTPAMFSTAAHSAIFIAIRTLPAPDPAEHVHSPAWLGDVLEATAALVRGVDLPYLHTLVQATRGPGHLPAYSAIIADAAFRRRLADQATRLARTASEATAPAPVTAVLREADELRTLLDGWAATPTAHKRALPRSEPPTVTSSDPQAADEELLLLATAVAHPHEAATLRLSPHDFTDPSRAALWKSVTAILTRQEMLDPLTLLCEAPHHGVPVDADPRPLLDTLSQPEGRPTHWATQILARALLANASYAGRRIAHYADDPALTPAQVHLGSRRALDHLDSVRDRWHRVTSPPPPPPRREPALQPRPRSTAPRTRAPRLDHTRPHHG